MTEGQKIIDLAMERMRPADIAAALKCSPNRVSRVLLKARSEGIDVPKFRPGRPSGYKLKPRVQVPHEVLDRLDPIARPLGLTARELAGVLLEKAVRDDLVAAILDDGGDDA